MRGEQLDEAAVGWNGLAGDRRYAFVQDRQQRNGFPWLTIRERPDLVLYRPSLAEPDLPNVSPVTVCTPAGDLLDVADPALAAELGQGVRVMKLDRGAFDTMPLSLTSTQTLTGLGALLGQLPDVRRFRPNLLVEATAATAATAFAPWLLPVAPVCVALYSSACSGGWSGAALRWMERAARGGD